jgi:transposase
MRKELYWLSDADWREIEPLLPRGRRGAHRERAHGIEGIRIKLSVWLEWWDGTGFPEDANALIESIAADLGLAVLAAEAKTKAVA